MLRAGAADRRGVNAAIGSVTSLDGTPIAFRRVGAGAPVVTVHGGLGSAESWQSVAECLADRFEVFLYDRRGRGRSGFGTEPHTFEREVEDARAVLGVAGRGAALVGHSFGGAVALELARTAGVGELSKLVVYEPAVGVGDAIPPAAIAEMERLLAEHDSEQAVALGLKSLDDAGLVRAGAPASARPPAARAALAALAPTVPRELAAAGALGTDLSRYRAIRAPTRVLLGGASPARQEQTCRMLTRVLADGQLTVLPGQGHVAHTADPDAVADHVGTFLG